MSIIRALALGGVVLTGTMLSAQAPDGGLPRRAWLGVALGPAEGGAAVTSVVDGSPAAAAGLRAGDVIRSVDGAAMRAPGEVIAAILRHAIGATASLQIVRAGQPQQQAITVGRLPSETLPGVTFEYGAVTLSDGSRLRTIVSVPSGSQAALPAVLLLPGGGCGSIDVPMAPDSGAGSIVRRIAARGFVTFRVEKSGVGDSRGPACDAIGYMQELEGYRAALAALKRHPSVDAAQVYLLGISLGGVFAPTLAGESAVRGIVVWGTPSGPPSPYPGRSDRFFHEIASADIRGAWSRVSSRVLVLHGEFDEGLADTDHAARIVAAVNASHPGAARDVRFDGLDHCWTWHESFERSRGRCGQGKEVSSVSDAVLAFLRG